jgi:hypothetical protein
MPGETRMQEGARGFELSADAIMYRWSVERDTWVNSLEIEQARAYLREVGIATRILPDGRYAIQGEAASALGAAQIVLLGLRQLHAARRAVRTRTSSP